MERRLPGSIDPKPDHRRCRSRLGFEPRPVEFGVRLLDAILHIDMRSPLQIWEQEIRAALFAVSPQKAAALGELMALYKITLDFVDDSGLHFRAYEDRPEIEVGWPALEALWCATYAYVALYQTRCSSQGSGEIQFHIGSRELSLGRDLYGWSINRLKGKTDSLWPAQLPMPTRPPNTDFDRLVLVLFLVGVAWILHHECGHQLLQRPRPADRKAIDLEWEADRHATAWVLDGVREDIVVTTAALGICIATGFIELHRNNAFSDTHPSPFERLTTALHYRSLPADGLAYAFALSVLQMNWYLREYKTWIQVEARSFSDLFEQFGVCLSGRPSSTWLLVRPEDAVKADLAFAAPLDCEITRGIAYDLWENRRRLLGTPEVDWFAAERLHRELRFDAVVRWLRENSANRP